jgi:hypothetical protein
LGRRVLGVRAQIERSDVGSCVMRRRRVEGLVRIGRLQGWKTLVGLAFSALGL